MNKKLIKYILSIGAAVILLYFSFRGVNWNDFMESLRNCRWEWIGVAMLAGVISFWLRALRWRELLLPIDPDTTRKATFNAINIGYLANLVLPRIGEFVRCGFVTRHSATTSEYTAGDNIVPKDAGPDETLQNRKKASYDKVLGTVVLERTWDVLTMLILVTVMAIFMWNRFGNFFIDKIFRPFSDRIDMSLWGILTLTIIILAAMLWAVWHFRHRNALTRMVFSFAKGLWQGVASCFKMKKWWKFMIYTALVWTMYWVMSLSVLNAVKGMDTAALTMDMANSVAKLVGLGAMDALFLMLAGSLSSLVPVPGGFGAFHYIVAAALTSIYGVPFGMGIVFATLSHESQTITQLICGLWSYISESGQFIKDK